MRENCGRSGRVLGKARLLLAAAVAALAFGALGVSSASAADQLDLTFDDAWIKLDALESLTGPIHGIDPEETPATTLKVKGTVANDGTLSVKKDDFDFPTITIPDAPFAGTNVVLNILAASDFTGSFDKGTGALSAQMPLTLDVQLTGDLQAHCQISPLDIPLSTTGSLTFEADPPGTLEAAPFAGGQGAAVGGWSGVTVDSVKGVAPSVDQDCKELIQTLLLLGGDPNATFDGSIWLGGTAATTSIPDPPQPTCETDPSLCPPPGTAAISLAKPKPAKVKAGKAATVKVTVRNAGGAAAEGVKVCPSVKKALKKTVKVPKCAGIGALAAGASKVVSLKIKTTKKAKGSAKVTIKASSTNGGTASTTATVKVQKAKKGKKK